MTEEKKGLMYVSEPPKVRASESNHWYTRDGIPQYTITGKNGKERNTTLRDARTMDLVPSVTTILGVAAKPALVAWMQTQVLMAALTSTRRHGEEEQDYIDRIISDSKQQGRDAADKGTAIHAAIESFFEGISHPGYPIHVQCTVNALEAHYGRIGWVAERSFGHELGFAGKCDLHAPNEVIEGGLVVDVKTKDFTDPKDVVAYEDHLMQLAAYRVGLGIPKARCANIFVAREELEQDGKRTVPCKIIEWSEEDLQRGWEMFTHLLYFWQLKNKHK
jgi:hypothetical protein